MWGSKNAVSNFHVSTSFEKREYTIYQFFYFKKRCWKSKGYFVVQYGAVGPPDRKHYSIESMDHASAECPKGKITCPIQLATVTLLWTHQRLRVALVSLVIRFFISQIWFNSTKICGPYDMICCIFIHLQTWQPGTIRKWLQFKAMVTCYISSWFFMSERRFSVTPFHFSVEEKWWYK